MQDKEQVEEGEKKKEEACEVEYRLSLAAMLQGRIKWQHLEVAAASYRRSPPSLTREVVSSAKADLIRDAVNSEQFNVLSFSAAELETAVVELLRPCLPVLHWSGLQLEYFVASVHSLYRNSPYHSWSHAVDVIQFMSRVLDLPHIRQLYSAVDLTTTLLSGLVHDIDHDGVTNRGHSALESERRRFSATSTQEKHHLAVARRLFHTARITDLLNQELMTHLIDATDMAFHARWVKEFETVARLPQSSYIGLDHSRRLLLLIMVMKSADLSNTVRNIETSRRWGELLGEEFHLAFLREISSHTPADRLSFPGDPQLSHDKLQYSFFIHTILPFYSLLKQSPLLESFISPLTYNALTSVEHFHALLPASTNSPPSPELSSHAEVAP